MYLALVRQDEPQRERSAGPLLHARRHGHEDGRAPLAGELFQGEEHLLGKFESRDSLLAAEPIANEQLPGTNPLAPRPPHFAPRARSVIFLFMSGGPSHVDLFDPKPDLIRLAGQPIPESFGTFKTRRNVAKNKLLPPLRPFRKHGQSGIEVSDFLPHIAGCVDDLCVLRGCYGDSVTHPESVYLMNTGSILMGRPIRSYSYSTIA
jgi:hypothetical protein